MRRLDAVHRTLAGLRALTAAALLSLPALAGAADIPARPEQIPFPALKFEVPKPEQYRHKLSNGVVVYVVEDHALPLVTISVLDRTGAFLDPAGKTGLAGITGAMMRKGGAGTLSAGDFDEKADFLAADLGSSADDTQGSASLNCLSSVLEPSLDLLFAMMRSPRFQQERLDVEKGDELEDMKQRNDDAGTILSREWDWLLYGEDHFLSREATSDELNALTRDDLVKFHRDSWSPQGMILAVSGDVDTKRVLASLEKRFAGWKAEGPAPAWPPPPPTYVAKPGLYHMEKDIPQGKVYIGGRSTKWDRYDNPDNYALFVMNSILGGGGFTSRITKKVRSDEGLAYDARSRYNIGAFYPLDYEVSYQTKSATVALAAKLSLAEVAKMKAERVTDDELKTAKGSFIDAFPRNFESATRVASLFAADDYMARPHSYWTGYCDDIAKVTADDVLRVAKKYLGEPDQMVFLVVGKWSDIQGGDADHRASMKDFFGGQVTHLPLRDPLTLKPLP